MLKKKISRLLPVADREAAERHYADIHYTFARDQFLRCTPDVVGYHVNRAIGQFDLNGTFRERPEAWRFVITRWEAREEHTLGFMDERLRNLFYADRPKCIGSVAACDVDERVLVDHMTGRQTALAKYLFRYAPEQFGEATSFDAYYDQVHLPRLLDALRDATGVRLFISNRAQQEAELEHRPDGTMAYTGRYLAPTTYCFEELYFDHEGHADAFFTSAPVLSLLRDSDWGRVLGYHVEEKCGVDRR